MTMASYSQYQVLEVSRVFPYSLSTVFNAWTDPMVITKWFGPKGFVVTEVKTNLYIGGQYAIAMQAPDQSMIYHYGEYVEITQNQQLVFTWVLADQDCKGSKDISASTLVTIDFSSTEDNGTLINLTHEKLPTEDAYNGHEYGWVSSLESLHTYLQE